MVTAADLINDERFGISDFDARRITERPVVKYRLKTVRLGSIMMNMPGEYVPLDHTDVYKYLDSSEESAKQYTAYCEKYGKRNANRTPDKYNDLIRELEEESYDIRKGGIFVDQNNILLDGQHRCCILMKRGGKNRRIEVVELTYKRKPILSKISCRIRRLKGLMRYGF